MQVKYKRKPNGLLNIPECKAVTESYVNIPERTNQCIMYNYEDERERMFAQSKIKPGLKIDTRSYFNKNNRLIITEVVSKV